MTLKWGIAGPGKIAHKFASDILLAERNELYAVASRSQERAESFARTFHMSKSYASYSELFDDKNVDIVYIATPHHVHAELSIQALLSGKHVLCEKPVAVNSRQASQIAQAADKSGCFFMEGLWTRFNPTFKNALALIKTELQPVKYIYADFCFDIGSSPSARLIDPALAGGALLDIGIYPIFLAYVLLGLPDRISCSAQIGPTGVDMSNACIFKYPDAHACLFSSFKLNSKMDAKIYGDNGTLILEERWHESRSFRQIREGKEDSFNFEVRGNGYVDEIEECHSCISNGKTQSSLWSVKDSLNLVSLLDKVRSEIGLKYPFE